MRERLYAAPYYRLVHAEADGLPGVIIDRFGDVAVIQPNAAWAESHIDVIATALSEITGVRCVVKNGTGRSRGLEGGDQDRLSVGEHPLEQFQMIGWDRRSRAQSHAARGRHHPAVGPDQHRRLVSGDGQAFIEGLGELEALGIRGRERTGIRSRPWAECAPSAPIR